MNKYCFIVIFCFAVASLEAQVGVNTTDPKAQLDIKASSETAPTNIDATSKLGQSANSWNTLFAGNGTIITSDKREKKPSKHKLWFRRFIEI